MSNQTTVRFREGQHDVIQEIERITHIRSDVPKMRQAEILRRLFDVGIEAAELSDLADPEIDPDPEQIRIEQLIGEAEVARYRHNRFKELEGWLRNQRTGFRTQVKRVFVKRFKNGYSSEEIQEFAENYRQKAHYLWPGEQHAEEREEAIEYVDAVLREAQTAIENSDRDPLDPEKIFASFSGVDREIEISEREEISEDQEQQLIEEIEHRIRTLGAVNDSDLLRMLKNKHDLDEETAEEIIKQARMRTNGEL